MTASSSSTAFIFSNNSHSSSSRATCPSKPNRLIQQDFERKHPLDFIPIFHSSFPKLLLQLPTWEGSQKPQKLRMLDWSRNTWKWRSLTPSLFSGGTPTLGHSALTFSSVFFTLLCVCIVIGHLLGESRWANESITALILGLCSGAVVLLVTKGKSSRILVFSEDLFFIYLLPPIIFNAGFQVKKKQFFRNFSTILGFGVVGTLISFCIISLGSSFVFPKLGIPSLTIQDYLSTGAIFSATDTVCTLQVLSQDQTPLLYSLVFGEGVGNDATSIVLFNAVQSLDLSNITALTALKLFGTFLYLIITSTVLGIAVGLISAYVIKTLYFGRHSTDREIAYDAYGILVILGS